MGFQDAEDTFYGTPFKISLFSLSLLLRHLQETMGRVAWRLSRSWPLKKACALLTRTRSTVTQGRNITTAFWGNYGSDYPKLVWWCVSARAWLSEVCWWPWGGSGFMESSSLLAGVWVFYIFLPFIEQFRACLWKAARCCVVLLMCMSPRQLRRIRPHTNSTE